MRVYVALKALQGFACHGWDLRSVMVDPEQKHGGFSRSVIVQIFANRAERFARHWIQEHHEVAIFQATGGFGVEVHGPEHAGRQGCRGHGELTGRGARAEPGPE